MMTERDTVLVIDDDPDLRALIEEIGKMVSVRVIHAPACCEGIEVLEREMPRIKMVLLDYFMPGMTPQDCAKKLKDKIHADIPVILVTASVDPSERAAELNISKWISKPFAIQFMQDILITGKC